MLENEFLLFCRIMLRPISLDVCVMLIEDDGFALPVSCLFRLMFVYFFCELPLFGIEFCDYPARADFVR